MGLSVTFLGSGPAEIKKRRQTPAESHEERPRAAEASPDLHSLRRIVLAATLNVAEARPSRARLFEGREQHGSRQLQVRSTFPRFPRTKFGKPADGRERPFRVRFRCLT
jgi:hypothetical protein